MLFDMYIDLWFSFYVIIFLKKMTFSILGFHLPSEAQLTDP